MKLFSALILLSSITFAYQDSDIDGVEDSVDKCPDSSFDEIVDENGCSPNQHYLGVLTLLAGSDISADKHSQTTTNFNFFANYRYSNWDITLSNANNTASTSSNSISADYGDLYLSTGYYMESAILMTKLDVGTKLATAEKDTGTGENDLFTSLYVNRNISQKQNLYLYYRYTLSGDSRHVDYKDFHTYSIGSGYALTPNWYSAFSYDYSGSPYSHTQPYKAVSWFNSYAFSKRLFATINYAYGLNDISPAHMVSLKMGVRFE
ncbi:MAG: hypothetical protein JW682_02765 [Campylobacterales bacterium]|nr:hypothetical protein [Campylobacterales bacterium]HEO98551.1 hypothetical protein [Campylobacterota bacterium]